MSILSGYSAHPAGCWPAASSWWRCSALCRAINKWLWVACIVAVGAWGAAGYGKAAAGPPYARGRRQAAAKLSRPCARLVAICTPPRADRGARPRTLRQIEADAARRTRNAEAARRAAAAQDRGPAPAPPPRRPTCHRATRQPPGPRTQPRSGSRRGPVMRAAILYASPPCWPAARPPCARPCATCPPPASARCRPGPTCRPSA